jgi:peptidyl-prolyl cis-trans isomerase C
MENMNFLQKFLIIAPAACLLAQTPPAPTPTPATPPATAPAAPKLASPVPPGLLQPAPVPPKPVTVPPDRVVLKAGSMALTAAQFEELVDGLPEQYKARLRGPGRRQFGETLEKLYILSEEGRRRKLDETHAYKVQSTLNDDQVLANLVVAQVGADTKVDEAEARKYYNEHIADKYEEVTARHILIRVKGSKVPVKPGAKDLTDEEALAKANDLRKRILAGEDFATLAKAESDDSSGANGGSLGAFPRGRMMPSFEQVAFALKPGELSEPVKTDYGYHIIKVEAHTTKPFEEVRPQIEKTLAPPKTQKTLDDMTKDAFLDPEFFGPAQPPAPPRGNFVPPGARPAGPPAAQPAPPAAAPPAPPATPPAPPKQ